VSTVRLAFAPPLDPADYPFRHRVRVRFAETDAMGIVHHAAYLPYLEEARVEFLRDVGHPYATLRAEGVDIAVLEASVRYLRPVHFDDEVDVHLVLASATRATFQIGYLLCVDDEVCSTAVTVHGCVDTSGRPVRLPAWIREYVRVE
jgi:acyl-CoA thioester hydrolase